MRISTSRHRCKSRLGSTEAVPPLMECKRNWNALSHSTRGDVGHGKLRTGGQSLQRLKTSRGTSDASAPAEGSRRPLEECKFGNGCSVVIGGDTAWLSGFEIVGKEMLDEFILGAEFLVIWTCWWGVPRDWIWNEAQGRNHAVERIEFEGPKMDTMQKATATIWAPKGPTELTTSEIESTIQRARKFQLTHPKVFREALLRGDIDAYVCIVIAFLPDLRSLGLSAEFVFSNSKFLGCESRSKPSRWKAEGCLLCRLNVLLRWLSWRWWRVQLYLV